LKLNYIAITVFISKTEILPVPGRGVGALGTGTSWLRGGPSSTGWCDETIVKYHTATEERELIGVTQEYTDTYNSSTAAYW